MQYLDYILPLKTYDTVYAKNLQSKQGKEYLTGTLPHLFLGRVNNNKKENRNT